MRVDGSPRFALNDERDEVDVIVLTRDGAPPPSPVRAAIASQESGSLSIIPHVVAGTPRPEDPNRFETIVRARNVGRGKGTAPWVMYVDDDIVLAPECISRLLEGLKRRPEYAALAADCLGQACPKNDDRTPSRGGSRRDGSDPVPTRRARLPAVPLGTRPLRVPLLRRRPARAGFAIDYLAGAGATHMPSLTAKVPRAASDPPASEIARTCSPRILCSFDRSHHRKFLRVFLRTLRAWGNKESVLAYAYGLTPSEQRLLVANPGVEAVCRPTNGICPAVSRLADFAEAVARFPTETPVAYWDAADVVFQTFSRPPVELGARSPEPIAGGS